ncbi:MAG: VanW family protein [Clostridia bacterium]|nr:VanW family protein [Clostridia bacterium]
MKKPIKRSQLRLKMGKAFYTSMRSLETFLHRKQLKNYQDPQLLQHVIFEHKTPLRRVLKDVDQILNDHKITNLNCALQTLNRRVIPSDRTFSYWKSIGKPTLKRGFAEGMVLDHGQLKRGVGGGLCQLSNMIYWMTLHTPLTVVERHRHSYDVFPDHNRTQPFASGATCVYNYRDLRIKNDTHEKYQFYFELDEDYLYGKILSDQPKYFHYEIYEKCHEIKPTYFGGYQRENVIHRKVFNMVNELIVDEMVCENKAFMMYSPLINPPNIFME